MQGETMQTAAVVKPQTFPLYSTMYMKGWSPVLEVLKGV